MRRLIFLLPLGLFLGLAVYLGIGLTKDPRKLPSALVDKQVPQLDMPALHDGAPALAVKDLAGDVTLVNFFASWCVPCKVEHPLWMALAKQKRVTIHGVAWKDARPAAIKWLTDLGDPYTRIGYDPDNRAGIEWGVYGVPETYVIDKTGRIRYKHVGPVHEAVWEKELEPLIRKLKAEAGAS